jgi:hypothetical protein
MFWILFLTLYGGSISGPQFGHGHSMVIGWIDPQTYGVVIWKSVVVVMKKVMFGWNGMFGVISVSTKRVCFVIGWGSLWSFKLEEAWNEYTVYMNNENHQKRGLVTVVSVG